MKFQKQTVIPHMQCNFKVIEIFFFFTLFPKPKGKIFKSHSNFVGIYVLNIVVCNHILFNKVVIEKLLVKLDTIILYRI